MNEIGFSEKNDFDKKNDPLMTPLTVLPPNSSVAASLCLSRAED